MDFYTHHEMPADPTGGIDELDRQFQRLLKSYKTTNLQSVCLPNLTNDYLLTRRGGLKAKSSIQDLAFASDSSTIRVVDSSPPRPETPTKPAKVTTVTSSDKKTAAYITSIRGDMIAPVIHKILALCETVVSTKCKGVASRILYNWNEQMYDAILTHWMNVDEEYHADSSFLMDLAARSTSRTGKTPLVSTENLVNHNNAVRSDSSTSSATVHH